MKKLIVLQLCWRSSSPCFLCGRRRRSYPSSGITPPKAPHIKGSLSQRNRLGESAEAGRAAALTAISSPPLTRSASETAMQASMQAKNILTYIVIHPRENWKRPLRTAPKSTAQTTARTGIIGERKRTVCRMGMAEDFRRSVQDKGTTIATNRYYNELQHGDVGEVGFTAIQDRCCCRCRRTRARVVEELRLKPRRTCRRTAAEPAPIAEVARPASGSGSADFDVTALQSLRRLCSRLRVMFSKKRK